MQLKTHQTGPEGQKVRRLYIEDGADIKKEYYVSIVTDRATQKLAFIASSAKAAWTLRRWRIHAGKNHHRVH
jgi:succinyl-CoA synthetase beta subunit